MSGLASEDELARIAYECWRAELPDDLPEYKAAPMPTQLWWYNRVGSYLELRWQATAGESSADAHVRAACQKYGGC